MAVGKPVSARWYSMVRRSAGQKLSADANPQKPKLKHNLVERQQTMHKALQEQFSNLRATVRYARRLACLTDWFTTETRQAFRLLCDEGPFRPNERVTLDNELITHVVVARDRCWGREDRAWETKTAQEWLASAADAKRWLTGEVVKLSPAMLEDLYESRWGWTLPYDAFATDLMERVACVGFHQGQHVSLTPETVVQLCAAMNEMSWALHESDAGNMGDRDLSECLELLAPFRTEIGNRPGFTRLLVAWVLAADACVVHRKVHLEERLASADTPQDWAYLYFHGGGMYDCALRELEKADWAAARSPDIRMMLWLKTDCEFQTGHFAKALKALKAWQEHDTGMTKRRGHLYWPLEIPVLRAVGKHAEALAAIKKALLVLERATILGDSREIRQLEEVEPDWFGRWLSFLGDQLILLGQDATASRHTALSENQRQLTLSTPPETAILDGVVEALQTVRAQVKRLREWLGESPKSDDCEIVAIEKKVRHAFRQSFRRRLLMRLRVKRDG